MIDLYNGDCLEIMDKLISECVKVDAIITDPPYGTTACKWDSVIPFDEMWTRLKVLRKDRTPIVLFGSEPFSSALRMSNIKEYKYDWIWHKERLTNPLLVKYQPSKTFELISCFYRHNYFPIMDNRLEKNKRNNKPRINKSQITNTELFCQSSKGNNDFKYPDAIREFNSVRRGIHPTQKPVLLMEYLIKTYTNEGDTVLDFTMGSGTTGVACRSLNRNFIGIERDNKYFKIAKERINE